MKSTFFLTVALAIFIPILIIIGGTASTAGTASENDPPAIVDGKQIIKISAKGGYSPRQTQAKANIPSIIRIKTKGTFDCSSSLVIPALKYASYLPASGSTDVQVPSQQPGTTLQGMCGMGMYNFSISFS